ncbi:MAG: hypothetical protein QW292_05760 [Candidatus Parvarchaeota archaeon]
MMLGRKKKLLTLTLILFALAGMIFVTTASGAIPPPPYTVSFAESGLYSGATFSVDLKNATATPTATGGVAPSTDATFSAYNGTYEVTGASATPASSGTGSQVDKYVYTGAETGDLIVVNGAAVAGPTISFTPEFLVTFSEIGLPIGAIFNVSVNHEFVTTTVTQTVNPTTVSVALANGSYSYTYEPSVVTVNGNIYTYTSNTVPTSPLSVAGEPVSVPQVSYSTTSVAYPVHFVIQVPTGTNDIVPPSWSVHIGGTVYTSTGGTIAITLTNGTYPYTIPFISGGPYEVLESNPHISSLVINGKLNWFPWEISQGYMQINVTFSQANIVNISAGNLPQYVDWSVSMYGMTSQTNSATGVTTWHTLAPVVTNTTSTKTYLEFFMPYNASSGVTNYYNFSVQVIPANWQLNAIKNGTDTTTVYPISIAKAEGIIIATGLDVANNVVLNFTKLYFTITFTETGLPVGQAWNIVINGVPYVTTNGLVTLTEHNGTLNYSAAPVSGYYSSDLSGSYVVIPQNAVITITYTPISSVKTYQVTFYEKGLPAGTQWSITINGQTYTTTSSSESLYLMNGSYAYTISGPRNYTISPSSGTVTVAGGPVSTNIAFTSTSSSGSGFSLPGTSSIFGFFTTTIGEIVLALVLIFLLFVGIEAAVHRKHRKRRFR